MNKKNLEFDDALDFEKIIRRIWKEKVLILSINILCTLLFFLYALIAYKEFKTTIIIKNPPENLYSYYNILFNCNGHKDKGPESGCYKIINEENFTEEFIHDLDLNIKSINNLNNFIEQAQGLDSFKEFLKKRNLSVNDYFQNSGNYKLGSVDLNKINMKDSNLSAYFLIFPEELEGEIFLKNYVTFSKDKTLIEFKKKLKILLSNYIIQYEISSDFARSINQETPFLGMIEVTGPGSFFYRGNKLLSKQIIELKKILADLESQKFNYDHIFQDPSFKLNVGWSIKEYSLLGLLFGLFLSFTIIFFKDINLKK
jgi:hypothetical protein